MKKILVADDKVSSRELVRTVLEHRGYRVIEAANGAQAVELGRLNLPHLFLLDLHMPVLDGFGAIGQLRAEPCFAATPIVALTASAMDGERGHAMGAGFTGYVTKPIRLAALRDEVSRLIG